MVTQNAVKIQKKLDCYLFKTNELLFFSHLSTEITFVFQSELLEVSYRHTLLRVFTFNLVFCFLFNFFLLKSFLLLKKKKAENIIIIKIPSFPHGKQQYQQIKICGKSSKTFSPKQ